MAKKATRQPAVTNTPPSLQPRQVIELLQRQVGKGEQMIASQPISEPAETAWKSVTSDVLVRSFGSASSHVRSVMEVGMFRNFFGDGDEKVWAEGRAQDMRERLVIMRELIAQLEHETEAGTNFPATLRPEPAERPETVRFINCTFPGEFSMTKQNVTAGGDITVGGHFVVADSIRDSFNKLAESKAAPDVQEMVRKLGEAVVEMSKELPTDKQQEAAQDFNTLATEAAKDTPRKSYVKMAAEGLITVATTAGNVAVTGLVTALLKHWGFGA